MTARAAHAFSRQLKSQIDYFRREYELTYAEAIGVMWLVQWDLAEELASDEDDEDEDQETADWEK